MADGAEFSIDAAALYKEGDRIVRGILAAGVTAIHTTTRQLEQRLEDLTRTEAGGDLWRAFQSSAWPSRGKVAKNPAGEIWLKGGERTRGAIKFWTEPGQVRRKGGDASEWMPVPLPAAGSRGRGRRISPGDWIRAHPGWLLIMVRRKGAKFPVLVAERLKGSGYRASVLPRGIQANGGRLEGTAIFMLVPFIAQRNAVAIVPEVLKAEGRLVSEFITAAGAVK